METRHRWLTVGALGVSVLVALIVEPPGALTEWLPERLWHVSVVAAALFLAALTLLALLGIVPLRLTLFGSRIEAPPTELASHTTKLERLQKDTEEIARMVRGVTKLVREVSEAVGALQDRVAALERRDLPGDGKAGS